MSNEVSSSSGLIFGLAYVPFSRRWKVLRFIKKLESAFLFAEPATFLPAISLSKGIALFSVAFTRFLMFRSKSSAFSFPKILKNQSSVISLGPSSLPSRFGSVSFSICSCCGIDLIESFHSSTLNSSQAVIFFANLSSKKLTFFLMSSCGFGL